MMDIDRLSEELRFPVMAMAVLGFMQGVFSISNITVVTSFIFPILLFAVFLTGVRVIKTTKSGIVGSAVSGLVVTAVYSITNNLIYWSIFPFVSPMPMFDFFAYAATGTAYDITISSLMGFVVAGAGGVLGKEAMKRS